MDVVYIAGIAAFAGLICWFVIGCDALFGAKP